MYLITSTNNSKKTWSKQHLNNREGTNSYRWSKKKNGQKKQDSDDDNGIEEIGIRISTSFITEFSCIGIKYSETIFGSNCKATENNELMDEVVCERRINLEWLKKIRGKRTDLLSWLKEAQRMGVGDDDDDDDIELIA